MNSAQSHPALTKAAHAIVTDNRAESQLNTERFLAEHSDHVDGLLFRAWTASSLDTAYYCLQRALELEPENLVATAGMNWMQGVWTLAHQQIEFDRREQDEIAQAQLQRERLHQEQLAREAQLEQERQKQAWEREEQERLRREQREQQQVERERLEQQFLEQQRLEQQQRTEQLDLQRQLFEQQLLEQCRLRQENQEGTEKAKSDLSPAPLAVEATDENPRTPILDSSQTTDAEAGEGIEPGSLRIFCSDEEDVEINRLDANDSIATPADPAQREPFEDPNHAKIEKFWAKMPQLNIPELVDEQEIPGPEVAGEPGAESQLQDFVKSLAQEVRDEINPIAPPAANTSQLLDNEVHLRATDESNFTSGIRKPLILAVDDSPTIRKLVSITLSEKGHDVVTAPDGVEALKLLAERLPDLILLDINMPRLSGYKLCNFLKKHERTAHIPVIMLSGNNGVIDKMRGKIQGCNAFIGKPFAPEELVKTVNQYLHHQTS